MDENREPRYVTHTPTEEKKTSVKGQPGQLDPGVIFQVLRGANRKLVNEFHQKTDYMTMYRCRQILSGGAKPAFVMKRNGFSLDAIGRSLRENVENLFFMLIYTVCTAIASGVFVGIYDAAYGRGAIIEGLIYLLAAGMTVAAFITGMNAGDRVMRHIKENGRGLWILPALLSVVMTFAFRHAFEDVNRWLLLFFSGGMLFILSREIRLSVAEAVLQMIMRFELFIILLTTVCNFLFGGPDGFIQTVLGVVGLIIVLVLGWFTMIGYTHAFAHCVDGLMRPSYFRRMRVASMVMMTLGGLLFVSGVFSITFMEKLLSFFLLTLTDLQSDACTAIVGIVVIIYGFNWYWNIVNVRENRCVDCGRYAYLTENVVEGTERTRVIDEKINVERESESVDRRYFLFFCYREDETIRETRDACKTLETSEKRRILCRYCGRIFRHYIYRRSYGETKTDTKFYTIRRR